MPLWAAFLVGFGPFVLMIAWAAREVWRVYHHAD